MVEPSALEQIRKKVAPHIETVVLNSRKTTIKRGNEIGVKNALHKIYQSIRTFVPNHPSVVQGRLLPGHVVESGESMNADPTQRESGNLTHPLPSDETLSKANALQLRNISRRFGESYVVPRMFHLLIGDHARIGLLSTPAFDATTIHLETDPKAAPFIVHQGGVHKLPEFNKALIKAASETNHPMRELAVGLGLERAKNPATQLHADSSRLSLPELDAQAYHHLGRSNAALGKYAAALEWFYNSTHVSPHFADARTQTLDIYADREKSLAAENQLNHWLKDNPEDTQAALHLATIYLFTKRPKSAHKIVEKYQEQDSGFLDRLLEHAESMSDTAQRAATRAKRSGRTGKKQSNEEH